MTRAVIVLGLVAACAEHPSLRVEVTHHPDARAAIARTTITVYESAIASCEKIEFGDLTEAELTAIEVDHLTLGPGEPADSLTMSRQGEKIIVARGFDAAGVLLAAGCEAKGTVAEGDVLPISTELAATVSVTGIGLDDLDPFGIGVTVTDPSVRALPDRVVSWRVFGANGAVPLVTDGLEIASDTWEPVGPPCTGADGNILIHPVPPSTIGGFATQVRTSWSTEPPRLFTTFTPLSNTALEMTPTGRNATLSQRRCTLRVAGAVRRLVCLEDRAGVPTAVDYEVSVVDGGTLFAERDTQTFTGLLVNEVPLNTFSIERGSTTRDAYALTSDGRLFGLFNPSLSVNPNLKLTGAQTATDVALLPACGASPQTLLIRVEAALSKTLQTLAVSTSGPLGGGVGFELYPSPAVKDTEGISINATGCIAELRADEQPTLRQVGVVDLTSRSAPGARNLTVAFYPCDTSTKRCSTVLPVARAGVGFLPADDQHPERMVSATFDASGTILAVHALFGSGNETPHPVELERITAASFPQHLVTGQFDGDGLPDLFWDIGNPNNATTNFQLSYAKTVLGERLSALSATQQDMVVVDTFVADIDGDGHDDLVITSQDRLLAPTLHRVLVIPGQVPIRAVDVRQDTACAAP